jgi:hypothetical protein
MELTRTALFDTPMWVSQIDEVRPFHDEMCAEVEDAIDSAPRDRAAFLAHQTPSDPFLLGSRGWSILEERSNAIYSALARESFQRWRAGEFHLRRWAIRLGRLNQEEKSRLARDGVHNHLPALLSSIYYLRVPAEFADDPAGGTEFCNPLANLMDMFGPRRTVVPPREGRLVIFPSFLDHAPVPVGWDAGSVSRIVVSTDLFYVSGEAVRSGSAGPRVAAAGDATNGP